MLALGVADDVVVLVLAVTDGATVVVA